MVNEDNFMAVGAIIGFVIGIVLGPVGASNNTLTTSGKIALPFFFPLLPMVGFFLWEFSLMIGDKVISTTLGAVEWHYTIISVFPLGVKIVGFKKIAPESEIVIPLKFFPGQIHQKHVCEIGEKVFMGDEEIAKVSFDAAVHPLGKIEIGRKAFLGCSNLSTLIFPCVGFIISDEAFKHCEKLKEVVWEGPDYNSGSRICSQAFAGCTNLEELTIPKNCEIEQNAFANCPHLKMISVPVSFSEKEKALLGVPKKCKIVVRQSENETVTSLSKENEEA